MAHPLGSDRFKVWSEYFSFPSVVWPVVDGLDRDGRITEDIGPLLDGLELVIVIERRVPEPANERNPATASGRYEQ